MSAVVFLGPTLSVVEARRIFEGTYLGPVSQGDVYRASRQRPEAIAIIDGYFNQVPAVWHKEILWALANGIPVFGSSSMGALRAAELHQFGMVGIGRVFEAFLHGVLEDDDEVALLHESSAAGYQAITEAMVNVRATLKEAERQNVLLPASRLALEAIMKELNYRHRRYATMLQIARDRQAIRRDELDAIERWLPAGRVDQKAADAVEMLTYLKQQLARDEPPTNPTFQFSYTAVFDRLRRTAGAFQATTNEPADPIFTAAILNEARLAPEWDRFKWEGLFRRLALDEAERQGIEIDEDELFQTIVEFRQDRKLLEPHDLEIWLDNNQLTPGEFVRLVEANAKAMAIWKQVQVAAEADILDSIRLDGRYASLVERAARKRAILHVIDANPPSTLVYQSAIHALVAPDLAIDDPRLELLARNRGFTSPTSLLRTLVAEHLYRNAEPLGDEWFGTS